MIHLPLKPICGDSSVAVPQGVRGVQLQFPLTTPPQAHSTRPKRPALGRGWLCIVKKRDLPSHDVADAFVLTFAEVGWGRQKVRRTPQASWRVT